MARKCNIKSVSLLLDKLLAIKYFRIILYRFYIHNTALRGGFKNPHEQYNTLGV